MPKPKPGLKIAELERISGVPRSTIHHYVNIGVLPPPRNAGPKLHYFDPDHVARLAEITRLREQRWPLARIREHLSSGFRPRPAAVESPAAGDGELRERILQQAGALFAERGYEGVRLTDISRALGIGKATIYRHFQGKHELFVACVERIRYTLIPEAARELVSDEHGDPREQGLLRVAAVLQHYSAYRSLNNLLTSVAHGRDPRLAREARAQLHGMVTNAEPYLRRLIESGQVRALDPELLAYILWGALMGAGERLIMDGRYTFQTVLAAYLDVVEFGLRGAAQENAQV